MAKRVSDPTEAAKGFHDRFVEVFNTHYSRVFRILDRLSGDPELAADLAQDAFVRLYRRGELPESPPAWLISVAMNLLRNAQTKRSRRIRLLTRARTEDILSDPGPNPDRSMTTGEAVRMVRDTLQSLPERERKLLLLRAEGLSYRDIAGALGLNPASVGTLLARAKNAFREAYGGVQDAS